MSTWSEHLIEYLKKSDQEKYSYVKNSEISLTKQLQNRLKITKQQIQAEETLLQIIIFFFQHKTSETNTCIMLNNFSWYLLFTVFTWSPNCTADSADRNVWNSKFVYKNHFSL